MKDPKEVIRDARVEHHGTIIDWPGHRSGWICTCGIGRKRMEEALPEWQMAAEELGEHENAAIFLALCAAGYQEVMGAALQSENKDG